MNKQIQLFLLPFAGGGSTSFTKLISCLDERIDAIPIEYPGRGSRAKEQLITDYQLFLDDAVSYITNRRNEQMPYALLGYSLGSALAFDIAAKGLVSGQPAHVIICARDSFLEPGPTQGYADLSDDEFAEKLKELGGIDERILENRRFRDIFLKPLRADYEIWRQFSYSPDSGKIPCDVTVIYSNGDVTCFNPAGWSEHTAGKAELYEMGHNHFFIYECYKEMAEIINNALISRREEM